MKNTACLLGFLKRCSISAIALLTPALVAGVLHPVVGAAAASEVISESGSGSGSGLQTAFRNSPKVVLDEAWHLVYQEYVDAEFNRVDWLGVRQTLLSGEYVSRDAAYSELRRVLRRLDPHCIDELWAVGSELI